MRICVVHQYYLGPGDPGISRYNEMARLWVEAGHSVTVIAGSVNHYTGLPAGGSRSGFVTRQRDGDVVVYRCFVPGRYAHSYVWRRVGYLAFTLSSSVAAVLSPHADVVIATSPPLFVVIAGWLKARLGGPGTPWVFEVRDLWPESAVTTGVVDRRSLQARLMYRLERWACRSADLISALTPGIRADIERRGLAAQGKIVDMPNAADLATFRPGPRDNEVRRRFGWGDRCVAMYAGAHGRANDLDQLVDAAGLLRDRSDIQIAFVGDGPQRPRLEERARELGLTNLTFCGAVPKEAMADHVNAADIGLAVLQPNPTFLTVYPNKIFDYMACARPIVIAIDGVARTLVAETIGSGIYAAPGDAHAIADAIRRLADDAAFRAAMGERGRAWVVANASRETIAANYLQVLRTLVAKKKGNVP
ncbi:MAG TPA: glycosyltransferase family 4 protein [Candidatus Limnocylindria bacterium]|nr:glycosyltransferase family 4 protein [Candidatus Limnocylindria bacterium]